MRPLACARLSPPRRVALRLRSTDDGLCEPRNWAAAPTGLPPPLGRVSQAPNSNGGRHCCQPPLRRAKDMPVFATWSKTREGPDPLSILAHQLRRRLPSNSSLARGARPIYQTARPEGSLVFRPFRPVRKPEAFVQNRPMFRGPSWETLYRVPLCFRAAKPPEGDRRPWSRVARQEDFSSGASYQLTSKRTRELFSLTAGGDRTFGHLPHLRSVAGSLARPGPPSRSPKHHAPPPRVAKAKNEAKSLWITGISVTTDGTFSA